MVTFVTMENRKKRGAILLVAGILLMLTHLADMDKVLLFCGIAIVALALVDLSGNDNYKRRF